MTSEVMVRCYNPHMTAYILIRVNVTDMERYRGYMALTPAILAQYQGRFIARGGESVTLEGPEESRRLALVEFPSLELAKVFYASPEYQAAKALRDGACEAEFVALDGL
jgi:uncharacterized protein (DUF1330 family)